MNPGIAISIAGLSGELVLLIRARLAAGEPEEAIVDWLVQERGWSREPAPASLGRGELKGAIAWVKEISLLPRPTFEHPNVTKALRERLGLAFGVCGTCGAETGEDGTRCNLCWEVEKRLHQYLKSEKGRRFARIALEASSDLGPHTGAEPGVMDGPKGPGGVSGVRMGTIVAEPLYALGERTAFTPGDVAMAARGRLALGDAETDVVEWLASGLFNERYYNKEAAREAALSIVVKERQHIDKERQHIDKHPSHQDQRVCGRCGYCRMDHFGAVNRDVCPPGGGTFQEKVSP